MLASSLCLVIAAIAASSDASHHINKRFIPTSKCYGELGCFSTGGDFYNIVVRPIQLLPQDRSVVGVKFYLFTQQAKATATKVTAVTSSIQQSGIDLSKPVKFIIHGFTDNGQAAWMNATRLALLDRYDANVIQVDWSKGAIPPYTQATANTRLVGAEIALLIQRFKEYYSNLNLANIHVIGHSLGAHTAGYAGKRFTTTKLGRVTGLDPAGPYFENMNAAARLAKTDATFVDAIHTNALPLPLGFGISQTVGQIDFYLNGGKTQPGCIDGSLTDISTLVSAYTCSHSRVTDFFTATIKPTCPYTAHRCDNYEKFTSGKCLQCTGGMCSAAGMNAHKLPILASHSENVYYMNTDGTSPFCGRHYYGATISFVSSSPSVNARLKLYFYENAVNLGMIYIPKSGYDTVEGGKNATGLLMLGSTRTISKVTLYWNKGSTWNVIQWFSEPKLKVSFIEIFTADSQTRKKYCTTSSELAKETTYTFTAC